MGHFESSGPILKMLSQPQEGKVRGHNILFREVAVDLDGAWGCCWHFHQGLARREFLPFENWEVLSKTGGGLDRDAAKASCLVGPGEGQRVGCGMMMPGSLGLPH